MVRRIHTLPGLAFDVAFLLLFVTVAVSVVAADVVAVADVLVVRQGQKERQEDRDKKKA